jgi:fatty acid desaturase
MTHSLWVLGIWYLALFTSFASVYRLGRLCEHLGTSGTHRLSMPRPVAWMLAPHDIFMHWEHHQWPAIPFWNLRKARALNTSVRIIGLMELFRFYRGCAPLASGAPTLGMNGAPLTDSTGFGSVTSLP